MSPFLQVWLQFAACIALIGMAGPELCRSGDIVAAKSGLPRSWIGVVLIAAVTSLPELITGISAVSIARTPDIAVGNVFGSCVFNLLILGLLDVMSRRESVYGRVGQGQILSAAFGILLIGISGVGVLTGGRIPTLGHVSLYTPVLLVLYVIAIRTVFSFEKRLAAEFAEDIADRYPQHTLRGALLRYAAAATVVVAAGTWLPFVAADLADTMGWERSFVGTVLVALVTTVPELTVTLVALRMGMADMAVANLLGSNLFDIAVLAIDDLFFLPGPLLAAASSAHAVSAFSAILMTALVLVGLLYRPKIRLFGAIGWISLGLVAVYVFNAVLIYRFG